MRRFEPILKALKGGSRWLLVEGLDPQASRELFSAIRSCDVSACWMLIEESRGGDWRMDWKRHPPRIAVVDATHMSGAEVAAHLKQFLKTCPEQKFVFLLSEATSRFEIPSYYGKGTVFLGDELKAIEAGAQTDGELLRQAHRIRPTYKSADLVLGPVTRLKFEEALSYIRTKAFCEDEWGFRERHSRGHGVTVLFHGASGTGKTMAAEVLASELGLPLYQVDLSALVSKWVGETEKNLRAVFKAAEGVRGVLLFDEADALFGSRTDVKSQQDRYGNMEVNYLLQEIERFEGILLLSTNHFNNMDPAFLRRFNYTITFGAPVSAQRKAIWERNIPSKMPLAKDVNLQHLSEFGLTGGSIKNCIRHAASRAAAEGKRPVAHEDFLWAIKRELQKHDLEISRETVGEVYWRKVAPEWEYRQKTRAGS